MDALQRRFQDASLFMIGVTARTGVSFDRIEQAVVDQVDGCIRECLSSENLERARSQLEMRQTLALETLNGVATALNDVNLMLAHPARLPEWAARYANVTPDDIRKAVARWIDTPNHLAIRFEPEPARQTSSPEPDRSQAPPFEAPKRFPTPEVKSSQLGNGLRLFVVERPELPQVAVQLQLKRGAIHSPEGKDGLAVLTLSSLKHGTRTKSGEERSGAG
jgi:zinc protease